MIVIDQTVLMPFLFRTESFAATVRVSNVDPVWVVPTFWRLDFMNQVVRHLRSGLFDQDEAILRLLAAEMLVRESHELIDNSALLTLAADASLSANQAIYILTAQSRGARLVTSDPAILKAGPDVAVNLETFGAI